MRRSVASPLRRGSCRCGARWGARWRRKVPALPAWGAVAALAASLFLWLGAPYRQGVTPAASPRPEPVQMASVSKRAVNHAYIDRLSGKDIAVRREPKSGTTIIWVSHQEPR